MQERVWDADTLDALNHRFSDRSPREILAWGYDEFGDNMVTATGFGTSGIVMMHILADLKPDATVFYLDTDLLFPETLTLKDRLSDELGIRFTRISTEISLEEQVATHGPNLWEKSPNTCCLIRKVLPLRRFLADKSAWVTGLRRHQASTRAQTSVVEWDRANRLVKINPLAHWMSDDVWSYIVLNKLPYNPLHDGGYPSIGCMPCTRAVEPGEDERAGRWAGRQKIECGIHVQSLAA